MVCHLVLEKIAVTQSARAVPEIVNRAIGDDLVGGVVTCVCHQKDSGSEKRDLARKRIVGLALTLRMIMPSST